MGEFEYAIQLKINLHIMASKLRSRLAGHVMKLYSRQNNLIRSTSNFIEHFTMSSKLLM